ncbi:hypothetical protein F5Y15DRAFT_427799 [Xylariaceae sp. FL0016]|nr:hypothetical protein F5Y15DRAFT_427799 [Xylariaceae sp. FL0016]
MDAPLPKAKQPVGTHHLHGGTAAKLTTSNPTTPIYDRYEVNEPPTTSPHQRQQRAGPSPQSPISDPRATPISQRRLRRTPNFSASPSPRPEAQQVSGRPSPDRITVTVGPAGRYVLAQEAPREKSDRPRPRRQLSQGNLSGSSLATSSRTPSLHRTTTYASLNPKKTEPHPVVRISKHTHSAILYALEETLHGPKQISEDPVEVYAQMADLMGGRGPPTSNGNSSAARAARAGVGSPSGIRGPRVIMQERMAREAKQKEERERIEREHAEEEARLQEEALRRESERRAAAAGAGNTGVGGIPTSAEASSSRRPAQQPTSVRATADNGGRTAGPSRATSNQAQASQTPRHGRSTSGAAQGIPGPSVPGPTQAGPSATQTQPDEFSAAVGRGRNSFPHAFERWETLSAHWEGLTSFWIRRLEQSAREIDSDPISQQLSRQVTDLSSAGANLFHAVVELQRLRASSERKFQRWFYETRGELERSREITAMMENTMEEERRSRADAIREAVDREQSTSKLQKQLAEMRKELTISKEEARRAWEELGRREQEERDRTTSLQLGQPTIVGGVQVVPMTQGVGRGNSQRDSRYAQTASPDYAQSPSHAARPEYTQAPPVQPVTTSDGGNTAFQTPSSVHHQQSYGSEGTYSEGEYTIDGQGNFVRDSRGHKIPFRAPPSVGSDVSAEEFETPATQPGVYQPPSSSAQQPSYTSAPDYTGTGYSVPGWEEMQNPRHHHPTRLSDVLEEEEERSRTSASQSGVGRS